MVCLQELYFNNVKAEDIYSSLTTVVFSLTYRPSTEFPLTISSSFWALEFSTVTPSCILTFLTYFSPRKFLTWMRVPPSEIAQEMGKWAYTALILYRYPFMTPLNMFPM